MYYNNVMWQSYIYKNAQNMWSIISDSHQKK